TYWSIVLEESTNNIYIVDQRTGGFTSVATVSAGVQINSTTATQVSANLDAEADTDPTPANNTYYSFIHGVQPAYDMTVKNITTAPYVAQGNTNITAEF